MRTLGFLLLVAVPILSGAGFLPDYQCTIERIDSSITPSGPAHDLEMKVYLGKQFSINRQTGVMSGALKNSYLSLPVVIDEGSSENAFKAVTSFREGVGSSIIVINVAEFLDGPRKPFLYTSDSNVYFGYCVHF